MADEKQDTILRQKILVEKLEQEEISIESEIQSFINSWLNTEPELDEMIKSIM